MKIDYLIVGAGFAGVTLAERISRVLGKKVLVVDRKEHFAGNSYDYFDENGILINKYGPHIFHTNSKNVFEYLSGFTKWFPYEHTVLAKVNKEYFPVPVNRLTINKFFGIDLKDSEEIKSFLELKRKKIKNPGNSEEVMLNKIGPELYKTFFEKFTKKTWLLSPEKLDKKVLERIPIKYDDDCRYFRDVFQYMPVKGFTSLIDKMLKHRNIEIVLNTDYKKLIGNISFDKLIYTGPVDYYFDYIFGKLPYRYIKFIQKKFPVEYYQPAPVINYMRNEKYYRTTESKHIYKCRVDFTNVTFEYTVNDGDPCYPKLTRESAEQFGNYKKEMSKLKNVIFAGRLATFRYYNIDQVVANSLSIFNKIAKNQA
jgi:UDP-galactopyranose mutase